MVNSNDRPVLPRDLAGTVAHAGVDPTLEGRALHDALRAAIATGRGSCWGDGDRAGWVVTLHSPEEQDFSGKMLEEALAWCLVWLMMPELGMGRLGCDGRCPADNRWWHRDVYVSGEARIAWLSMAERCSSEPWPGSG